MTPKIESMTDLVALLKLALSNRAERVSAIKAFQNYVFDTSTPVLGAAAEQWETLNDLAVDLDYYEPDPVDRREDPSYYGDQRVEVEIRYKSLGKSHQLPIAHISGESARPYAGSSARTPDQRLAAQHPKQRRKAADGG